MEKFKKGNSLNFQQKSGRGTNIILIVAASFILFLCNSPSAMAQGINIGVNITLPFWAPVYDNVNQVQYYYLPDIECYYDVWNHEYVYMEDGNWMFAAQLPPSYAWYDFNSAFVVVLNANVHQPWMHFHYYVAHYPKYYYRTVYRTTWNEAVHPVRGFNENVRTVVYRNTEVRHEVEPRREPVSREQRVAPTRPPQRMEYYGKTVGRPVKVEKQMRRPREVKGERK